MRHNDPLNGFRGVIMGLVLSVALYAIIGLILLISGRL
jgi:hypothetical protein